MTTPTPHAPPREARPHRPSRAPPRFHTRAARAATIVLLLLTTTCSRHRTEAPAGSAPTAEGDHGDRHFQPYPHGTWRLASGYELARTVLWTSHIVIMHSESDGGGLGFRPGIWKPDTRPTRTRDEAYHLALDVMRAAQKDPTQFARLARLYSDDVVTRETGGSLGALAADDLPAVFLDALEPLRPGEVSNLVQTQLGYHILLRRSPPPREEVNGARVVVRYQTTFGDGASERSRSEALELARSIAAEARSGADFASLVATRSEGSDRDRGGNLGVWATDEPGPNGTVIEALANLAVGEVRAEPVDTQFGFQVIKRTAPGLPEELGARVARFSFDPRSPDMEASARKSAEAFSLAVRRDPAALDAYPSLEPIRWRDGHGDPVLSSILDGLRRGQTTSSPVRLHSAYAVVRRVDPGALCARPPLRYDLPGAETVDIGTLMGRIRPELLVAYLDEIRPVLASLPLPASERSVVTTTLDGLRAGVEAATTPAERVDVYHRTMTTLHKDLSESAYAVVASGLQRWVGREVIKSSRL
jgi:hypothetical protein